MTPEQQARLAKLALKCRHDPLLWAETAYPWGQPGTPFEHEDLRWWQAEVLDTIHQHITDPEKSRMPCRIAVASGHGIGKSAGMGMIANWAMTCWPQARVLVTANTEGQLRTKTSPEIAKWFRNSLSADLFDIDILRIAMGNAKHRESWRLDFVPWSEKNTEAFQGLHNKSSIIVILVDEGSVIPHLVYDVMEGAMTDEGTVVVQVVFGNPTSNTGRFREFFRKFRSVFYTWQIDSRTVPGTNKTYLQSLVDLYGITSDYVKVRVLGQFPNASARQFIPQNLIDDARGRNLRAEQYDFAPSILTCDPAWTGDDELVIAHRKGLFFEILEVIAKNNNDVLIAQKLRQYELKLNAQAVFIDAGYGTGIKSAGDNMGAAWKLVWFAAKPADPGYVNKRSEMWAAARTWLEEGGAIPPDDVLCSDLAAPETLPQNDGRVALESKEQMRKRGEPSPNRADALVLSFAYPVAQPALARQRPTDVVQHEAYDPLASMEAH